MNSKERVLRAVNFAETDRTPMSLGTNGWVKKVLYKIYGFKNHKELLNYFHSDIVDLRDCCVPEFVGPGKSVKALENGIRENHWGWRTKIMDTPRGDEEQFYEFLLKDAGSIEEMEKHNWPSPDWFDFSNFKAQLDSYSDLCVMASGGSVFQHPQFLRGMDTFLMDIMMFPDIAEYLMDKYTNFYLTYFDKMFSATKGSIDIFRVADDVAMQSALLISPEIFDQFVAPRLKKLIDLTHSYGLKFMLHSCGDVTPLIPHFIELGVDILDPIQVAAANMDLIKLHNQYGHKICLHGGIDTQQFLPNASPQEVRQNIRETLNLIDGKSGYILSTSHVIEGDIPTDNISALFDEGFHYQNNCITDS